MQHTHFKIIAGLLASAITVDAVRPGEETISITAPNSCVLPGLGEDQG